MRSPQDSRSSGELLAQLIEREEPTEIHRIASCVFVGEDPRKELRQKADLSDRRDRRYHRPASAELDAGSQRGNWTQLYLQMIHDQPNIHAAILAKQIGPPHPAFQTLGSAN